RIHAGRVQAAGSHRPDSESRVIDSTTVFYRDSHHVYRVPELDELPWLLHGFGTRESDIPAQFGNLATLKQIHSAACVLAAGRAGELGEGDALLENTPGSVVA